VSELFETRVNMQELAKSAVLIAYGIYCGNFEVNAPVLDPVDEIARHHGKQNGRRLYEF
jgi:hypothetical protein